jgi:hypothetical protein
MKLTFLVWLFMPQTFGCEVVYTRLLRPLLRHHRQRIDTQLDRLHHLSRQAGAEIKAVSGTY